MVFIKQNKLEKSFICHEQLISTQRNFKMTDIYPGGGGIFIEDVCRHSEGKTRFGPRIKANVKDTRS